MNAGVGRTPRKSLTFAEVAVLATLLLVLGFFPLQIPRLPDLWREYQSAGCLSHLRQLTAATRLYLADNDDMFPYAGRDMPFANQLDVWRGLTPYVSGPDVFLCPQDSSPAFNVRWVARNASKKLNPAAINVQASYGYFASFFHPFTCAGGKNVMGPARSMPLAAVVDPGRKAIFNCYSSEWAGGRTAPHHPAGWALGFVDGRARLVPYTRLNRGVRNAGIDEVYNLDWTMCGIAGRDLR